MFGHWWSNARVGLCDGADVTGLRVDATPGDSKKFFAWMAAEILAAAAQGAKWAVIGVPGLVSKVGDQQAVGPLINVPGLADGSHILEPELTAAEPKIAQLVSEGFVINLINDGQLAAFAATTLDTGPQSHDAIASLIVGTGVGGSVVRRHPGTDVFYIDEGLFEFGHIPLSSEHDDTFETTISGTSLHRRHGMPAEDIGAAHAAWREVGTHMAQLTITIGLLAGVDLIVACGGVGSNAYEHYRPYLDAKLTQFAHSPNPVQRAAVPKVIAVPPKASQYFELKGAVGAMRSYHFGRAS